MSKIKFLWVILLSALILAGCSSSRSVSESCTFHLDTGDAVSVKLDTRDGMKLEADESSFTVKKGETELAHGAFITGEMREQYISSVKGSSAEIISDTEESFKWEVVKKGNGTEYDRIEKIGGSDIYALIGSLAGWQASDKAVNALTFTVESAASNGGSNETPETPEQPEEPSSPLTGGAADTPADNTPDEPPEEPDSLQPEAQEAETGDRTSTAYKLTKSVTENGFTYDKTATFAVPDTFDPPSYGTDNGIRYVSAPSVSDKEDAIMYHFIESENTSSGYLNHVLDVCENSAGTDVISATEITSEYIKDKKVDFIQIKTFESDTGAMVERYHSCVEMNGVVFAIDILDTCRGDREPDISMDDIRKAWRSVAFNDGDTAVQPSMPAEDAGPIGDEYYSALKEGLRNGTLRKLTGEEAVLNGSVTSASVRYAEVFEEGYKDDMQVALVCPLGTSQTDYAYLCFQNGADSCEDYMKKAPMMDLAAMLFGFEASEAEKARTINVGGKEIWCKHAVFKNARNGQSVTRWYSCCEVNGEVFTVCFFDTTGTTADEELLRKVWESISYIKKTETSKTQIL